MRKGFRSQQYMTAAGKNALSIQLDIRAMAEYPDAVTWAQKWDQNPATQYLRAPQNADDARKLVENFEFPTSIRTDARRASRELTQVFQDVAKLLTVRHQLSGKIDRRKLNRLVETSIANTYKVEEVRPYRRTQAQPAERPTVAIIASGSFAEMWNDPHYIPRVLTLILGIQWACEASELHTATALVQNAHKLSGQYADCVRAIMLNESGQSVPLKAYATCLQSDMFRMASLSLVSAHPELTTLQNSVNPYRGGKIWSSSNGGNAVQWAREVLKADVVIAIGNIRDRQGADVVLDSSMSLKDAVRAIAKQAAKLN